MKVFQYAINIDHISSSQLECLKTFASKERLERVKMFRYEEDVKRSILAEIIVKYEICKHFGIDMDEITFDQMEYGKLFVKGHPELCFNLSHSGKWVVCALSNKPVGIDVEEVKDDCISIAKRFFTLKENERINACKSANEKKQEFFQLWTLKESYMKEIGLGFHKSLNSFEMRKNNQMEQVYDEGRLISNCKFDKYRLGDDYWVSICSENEEIGEVTIENLDEILGKRCTYNKLVNKFYQKQRYVTGN